MKFCYNYKTDLDLLDCFGNEEILYYLTQKKKHVADLANSVNPNEVTYNDSCLIHCLPSILWILSMTAWSKNFSNFADMTSAFMHFKG